MGLTLVRSRTQDGRGVSRQGGSGIGGGAAAGRHQAVRLAPRHGHSHHQSIDCGSCLQPIRGTAVVIAGRLYCTWDCAVSFAGMVPGQYFG